MNNCLFKCRGPSQLAGAPSHFLVGRGIRVGIVAPFVDILLGICYNKRQGILAKRRRFGYTSAKEVNALCL